MMWRVILAVTLLLALTPLASPETETHLTSVTEFAPQFPDGAQISADIGIAPDTADGVSIVAEVAGSNLMFQEILLPGEWTSNGDKVTASTFLSMVDLQIPPGVEISFWWEVTLSGGRVMTTELESLHWIDDRFEWTLHESEQVRMYSYRASDDFAAEMLRQTQSSIDSLEARYELTGIEPISIWIYNSYADWAPSRQATMRESIAGISWMGYSLIVGIVPDGDSAEFARVIPHEISHQMLSAATADAYGNVPVWFDEALATHTQTGGTDGFPALVRRAWEADELFRIESLNASFPFQPAQATLAYAASWSILTYIEATWGPAGTVRLIDAFASGLSVDDAIVSALDVSMEELNDGWHEWVGSSNESL